MSSGKHCLKHAYRESGECCVRCKAPLCPDCRIKKEEQPYCSLWCLFHDKAARAIKSFTHDISAGQIESRRKLVLFADLLIVSIIVFFTAASIHFFEHKEKTISSVTAGSPKKVKEQGSVLIKKSLIKKAEKDITLKPVNKKLPPSRKDLARKSVKKKPPYKKKKSAHRRPQNIRKVAMAGKKISITFDGGSSDSSAETILHVLSAKQIKTTFFLTGKFLKRYPDLVKRIVEEGHEIGNHTYSHPHLTTYSKNRRNETSQGINFERLKDELEKTDRLYYELTGKRMAPFWRAPYGEINDEILNWASRVGYQHIAWTVDYKAGKSMDSLDWVSDKSSSLYFSAEEIKERLLSFADDRGRAKGGIILMHLGTERKEDAAHEKLAEIIDNFAIKGYKLVPVSHLVKVMFNESGGKNL
ncbi:MAG: polysaccharide deacetylase family protein [Deltaproteobacteria bacterium]|nr:polysaccharide deacetylase family protein [Deltaproteobacteria bacterium]